MAFYFSAYSTPLLFGFVQAWIYALLLIGQGLREERLSGILLGGVLIALAFEIWIYLLGFAGIEIFWRQLNFFPRTLGFLLPPLVYFYLRAQFNASFRFRIAHLWHLLPFALHTAYHLAIFARGQAYVRRWEATVHYLGVDDLEFVVATGQRFLYLYWSFRLYYRYRTWIETQFSDLAPITFRWYRNFLIALLLALVVSLLFTFLDAQIGLTYGQNWWNNLAGVVLIYYVSITSYAQTKVTLPLYFDTDTIRERSSTSQSPESSFDQEAIVDDRSEALAALRSFMDAEKPYLNASLSVADLARQLHSTPAVLSRLINAGTDHNFNSFVNSYRIDEFKRRALDPQHEHLSFLAIALDCGFNSKATFNRSFKKATGQSPKAFVQHMRNLERRGRR